MGKTIEELREYARERYRRLHNVPPERFQDGRSHPDNLEYHREIKKRYYYRHKERLSLLKKEEYQKKKNSKNESNQIQNSEVASGGSDSGNGSNP